MAEDGIRTALKGIRRNDPEPRPVEGTLSQVEVTGKSPNKHYVWVSEVNNLALSPQTYLSMGYRFTQYDKDAEQPPMLGYTPDLKQGDQLRGHGCVMMEIDKEKHDDIVQNGTPGGGQGQKWGDAIQNRIRRMEELPDPEESREDRARTRGIRTGSYGDDNRSRWSF